MPMYETKYRLPNGSEQGTQCYAESEAHLEEVIKLRGLGETRFMRTHESSLYSIFGTGTFPHPKMASDLLAKEQYAAANHALTWTSMIAVKAGVVEGWDLLNDQGIMHEMAHMLHSRELNGGSSARNRSRSFYDTEPEHLRLARRIETFERLVPGVHPCWAGEDTTIVPAYKPPVVSPFDSQFMTGFMRDMSSLREAVKGSSKAMAKYSSIIDEYVYAKDIDFIPRQKREKPGTKKFAEQQRTQGADAKAAMIAKQMDKLKAKKKEASKEALLKRITDDHHGRTPDKVIVSADYAKTEDRITAFMTRRTGKSIMVEQMQAMIGRGGTITARTAHIIPEEQNLPVFEKRSAPIPAGTLVQGDKVLGKIKGGTISYDIESEAGKIVMSQGDKTIMLDIDGVLTDSIVTKPVSQAQADAMTEMFANA